MNPLNRLLRYARTRTAAASLAAFAWMLLYGGGVRLPRLPRQGRSSTRCCRSQRTGRVRGCGHRRVLPARRGSGRYFSAYLMADVGQRVVMDVRNALYRHMLDQSAAFFARRTTGPADVADPERRRPDPAGGLRDDRRPAARVAGARRLRGLLLYYDARLALVCLTGAPLVVYPLVRLGQRLRRSARAGARRSSSTCRT